MKGLRYFILPLALLACVSAGAKGKKKTKKAKKAQVEVVDTCSAEVFSYAIGLANTNGLKNYLVARMNVDTAYMADFLKGFDTPVLTEEGKRMQAFCAGLEIRQQVANQIIPGLNHQIDESDSLKTVVDEKFIEGFRAGIAGGATLISADSAQKISQKQMAYYNKTKMERKYGANRLEGEAFLKANAKKDSVKTLPSGVQYKVLTQGTGEIPTATSRVKVNYEGRLIDGTVFDSSYKRNQPTTFGCNQVIKGWTEALTHMPVGSKWEIYIPQELAYGEREAGKIKPFSTLIFTVELLEIEK